MISSLSSLSARAIDGAGAATILVVLSLAYLLGIHPALDRRAAAEAERATLAAETADAEAAQKELDVARARLSRLKTGLASVTPLKPIDQANSQIGRLTELARKHAITIRQLAPGATTTDAARACIVAPFSVQAAGRFSDCIEFLAGIRRDCRDIAVPNLHLLVLEPASENVPSQLEMTFDLVWYAAPAGSAGAP